MKRMVLQDESCKLDEKSVGLTPFFFAHIIIGVWFLDCVSNCNLLDDYLIGFCICHDE